MKVDELKKNIKRVFKGKISITYGMIIALILGAGMYTEVIAATIFYDGAGSTIVANPGDTAINTGTVTFVGDYGMYAETGAEIINKGTIENEGRYGMYAEALVFGDDSDITATSTAINRGTIMNFGQSGDDGMEADAKAIGYGQGDTTAISTATNRGTIMNFGKEYGDCGMDADAKAIGHGQGDTTAISTVTNYGTINNHGYDDYTYTGWWGMKADAEAIGYGQGDTTAISTATNYGIIQNEGAPSDVWPSGEYGMEAYTEAMGYGQGDTTAISTITNYGTIKNSGNYGMSAEVLAYRYVVDGTAISTATNYGIIENGGDYGMRAYANVRSFGNFSTTSTAINYGTIENGGNFRMYAMGIGYGEVRVEAINEGELDTGFDGTSWHYEPDGDGYVVMIGTNRASITNNGTIDVDHDYGIAMYVDGGADAVNNGTINLNGKNGIGMYATGEGSTIENYGEIHLYKKVEDNSYQTPGDTAGTNPALPAYTITNGMDSKGNIGMKIENGARMINRGQIVFGKE
ncbi:MULTISPECIES: hypothetical protein [Psychrilyobacter]|uniref:Uncharacterized protein n=1 Tax=Psychrilyobacter piezotolerans TaxID=2293438 RepID=A0ABX9KJ08_9FUSO|nr:MULTISPECIES: hypothetical protein [Psychrilyobacter]MCS5421737.1 hypothetical protein [Psychrilyobacter sp. S5]NDI77172.1 hypothetical protein [Psychrilyobacter piezotolerans]RDE64164.1 hypothetical protein DV867_04340 [Psychrilyobacter sp. S5]REI42256.1 hypothetical protein DYH56_04340 [Psychrilyobacter piezotolerans]